MLRDRLTEDNGGNQYTFFLIQMSTTLLQTSQKARNCFSVSQLHCARSADISLWQWFVLQAHQLDFFGCNDVIHIKFNTV